MTPVTQAPPTRRSEQLLLFGRNFLKHPRMLGSLIPSSRFVVDRVLGQVDWARARTIVEYGPGVGTLTGEMLRRLRPDGTLLAIEMNRDFVRYLRRTVPDRRLHVVEGSAADADSALASRGLRSADYVISGIPYSTMLPDVRDRILRTTHDVLHQDGAFLVYQFTRAVLPFLQETFARVDQGFEPRNIMPARLFFCRRQPDERPAARTREPRPRARASS
ncbi:MAG TPA: rRNA adenine N-6-methyltransferase family protein [Gemmatimonadales bacterium]|nr:rRNA adenine N-6-methyltransferase family protein [Gemmatimonadales bacterium]